MTSYKTFAERVAHTKIVRERERKRLKDAYEMHLLRTYGMTTRDKQNMLDAQHGQCANIGCALPLLGPLTSLHVDHCHKTGIVRGLLCDHCNFALGFLHDDAARIMDLLEYLYRAPQPRNKWKEKIKILKAHCVDCVVAFLSFRCVECPPGSCRQHAGRQENERGDLTISAARGTPLY